MITVLSGKRLLTKLAECPEDSYPHNISSDSDGELLLHGRIWINPHSQYAVIDNVRNRDAESVNTIDSDWTVDLAD